jgi:hypothetical protein
MAITNRGQVPVQITQIRMKLTTNSQPNNHYYHLVNACFFYRSNGEECEGRGEGQGYQLYTYSFRSAHKDAVFQGEASNSQPVLQPKDSLLVKLVFQPKDTSSYLTYSIMPEFVLNTPNTQAQVFDLPQLTGTVSFAGVDHFFCYQLRGNTFIPLAPSVPINSPSDGKIAVQCI